MTLIKSISGIRGTIGGETGENLTPLDIVKFSAAYAAFIKESSQNDRPRIVIGRDARISGEMVSKLVAATLQGLGIDVAEARVTPAQQRWIRRSLLLVLVALK